MTLRNYRPFVNPDIRTDETIYRHILTPLTATHDRIEFFTNTDANNMQGVIEELAETITYYGQEAQNADIYQRHFTPEEYDFPDEEWIQLGNGDAIANCWQNVITETATPEEALDAAYNNAFMTPRIIEGDFWRYENDGTHWTDDEETARNESDPTYIDLIEREHGFIAYTSADGYLDCTEPALFETREEAAQYLLDERN